MKKLEKIIGIALLICAVGFNFWLYRLEPTSLVDPNDNTFQYALVHRTNDVLAFASTECRGFTKPLCIAGYLVDHWVPNWAQGYNLPYYYSHVPQIMIVLTWKIVSLFTSTLSLFTYYHWVIYFLLCLFPVSVFLALRTINLSFLIASIGAIAAAHVSTDGLYGLDPASFVWRGYGLSSQLFAMIWLPLAIATSYRFLVDEKKKFRDSIAPILLLAATISGHLGIGIIAMMSVFVLAVSPLIQLLLLNEKISNIHHISSIVKKLLVLFVGAGLLLAYWIVPLLIHGDYHNISVWDGIWKFNSYGAKTVLTNFFNGDLFDFGRAPVLTILVIVGIYASLVSSYFPFALLFVFWLLFYFGRTTWGGLVDLIPGMSEFHLSRFIVGVHLAGIFAIPIALGWLQSFVKPSYRLVATLGITLLLAASIIPQTVRYATHNDFLITRGISDFHKTSPDIEVLQTTLNKFLKDKPGRVFAGRGGSWGKDFRIAETPMYMYLSNFGTPVILWLPETWSPNSDTEQYFSEGNLAHYTLYNVRYIVTPINLAREHIQPFWKFLTSGATWTIYEVDHDSGYITPGVTPAIVSSDKEHFRNVIRHWMLSRDYLPGNYPLLTFDQSYPKDTGLPNFRMLDEVTYQVPAGTTHNIFAEVPRYASPSGVLARIENEQEIGGMKFTASIEVPENCTNCIAVLKQSYHPSWQATIDGKKVKTFAVFPFYTAVALDQSGTHRLIYSYQPSLFKYTLLMLTLFGLLGALKASGLLRRRRP